MSFFWRCVRTLCSGLDALELNVLRISDECKLKLKLKLCDIIIKTPLLVLRLGRLPFARKTGRYGTVSVFAKFLFIHAALIFQPKVTVLHRDFLVISVEMDSISIFFLAVIVAHLPFFRQRKLSRITKLLKHNY